MLPPDLADWRKRLRAEMIAHRIALGEDSLAAHRLAIDAKLRARFHPLLNGLVAFCWPYKKEYDARPLMEELRTQGIRTVLPVVVAQGKPLIFREWHSGISLAVGTYGIPYPAEGQALEPDVLLLPMNAFDQAGFRLGYGGGFFDRTLAAASKKPTVIGIAHEINRVETIYPEAHDIPMDFIVTENAIYRRSTESLVRLD
ncbi:MAG TPA: 5-formyltetrahydrofolate cyclo-ligase [Burkholderiales bacterium]|nr:5-formyltetrahydrofolate cyclo-ligase [Burkholderiales bacterium]